MARYRVIFNLFTVEGIRLQNNAKLTLEVEAETAREAQGVASDEASSILNNTVQVGGMKYDEVWRDLVVSTVKISSKKS